MVCLLLKLNIWLVSCLWLCSSRLQLPSKILCHFGMPCGSVLLFPSPSPVLYPCLNFYMIVEKICFFPQIENVFPKVGHAVACGVCLSINIPLCPACFWSVWSYAIFVTVVSYMPYYVKFLVLLHSGNFWLSPSLSSHGLAHLLLNLYFWLLWVP